MQNLSQKKPLTLALFLILSSAFAMAAITLRFLPSKNERRLALKAKQFEQNGKFEEALRLYEEALKSPLPPYEKAVILSNLSGLHYRQSRLDPAQNYLKKAIALYPVPAFSFQLALFYYEQDNLNEALLHLKNVYRDNPSYPGLQKFLSILRTESEAEKQLQVFESAHFTLKARREEINHAQSLLSLLEDAHEKLRKIYPFPLRGKNTVKVFDDFTFESLIGKPVQSTSAVSINGKLFIRSPRLHGIGENMRQIVVHEYVHILFHRLLPKSEPVWLHEGIAAYFSDEYRNALNKRAFQDAVNENTLLPLSKLRSSWEAMASSLRLIAYTQSAQFIHFLISKYSWEHVLRFIFFLSAGSKEPEAFAEIFSATPETMENHFLKWLGKNQ